MPQIAISTGAADALECLILKLGIDPKEFTISTKSGRVHMYTNMGAPPGGGGVGRGADRFVSGWAGGSSDLFTDSQALWNTEANLKNYDIVLLSCEGDQYQTTKPQAALDNMHDYAGLGGRVFMSHWHNIRRRRERQPEPRRGRSTGRRELELRRGAERDFAADDRRRDGPEGNVVCDLAPERRRHHHARSAHGQYAPVHVLVQRRHQVGPLGLCRSHPVDAGLQGQRARSRVHDPARPGPEDRCGKVVFSDMHVSSDRRHSRVRQPVPEPVLDHRPYAPNGTLPLYGVNVYVPASDPGPLVDGATCARCDQGLQGGALAQAVTDEAGHFSLQNVPSATTTC